MYATLESSFQVVYNNQDGRQIYFPASRDSELLASELRKARAEGLNARLSQVN